MNENFEKVTQIGERDLKITYDSLILSFQKAKCFNLLNAKAECEISFR